MLRLEEPSRYRLDATHPVFNRRLWSLQVQGSEAILVDYLQDLHCRYRDEAEIPAIPLGPFPFASLPRLLMGYLPLEPAGPVERRGGVLRFRDGRQRVWTVRPAKGAIEDWIVSGTDKLSVHWFSSPEWLYLVSETEETELRWRETLREPVFDGRAKASFLAGKYRRWQRVSHDALDDTLGFVVEQSDPRAESQSRANQIDVQERHAHF